MVLFKLDGKDLSLFYFFTNRKYENSKQEVTFDKINKGFVLVSITKSPMLDRFLFSHYLD